jgi:hypothetical protein
MVMDGSKEQLLGKFCHKCRQAGLHVKQTEPYTPWSNATEGAIREVKRGAGREMVRSRAPKRLWDDCLEREALVQSCTAHDIYRLDDQVPQTILKGETADISAIALFQCWYDDWVIFRDTSIKFPDDNMVLGCNLGPAIDIRPAMTRKILKENGQTVIRSTVHSLTPDELKWCEDHKAKRKAFDVKVNEALGDAF